MYRTVGSAPAAEPHSPRANGIPPTQVLRFPCRASTEDLAMNRRLPAYTSAALSLLLLAACASSKPVVQTDKAAGVDFARYHTYTWVEEPQTQSPLVRDKLVRAIDAQLAAKGWQRTADGDVALLGKWDAREEVSYSNTSFGFGLGSWGGNSGGGIGTSTGTSRPNSKMVGALAIDMFD